MSLNAATGAITGTPIAIGSYTFTIDATDSVGGSASQSYTVAINSPPSFSPTTLPNWDQNLAGYDQTISATGGMGTITLSLEAGSVLPTGLTFDADTGIISGIPTAIGSYEFAIDATDGVGDTVTESYTVVINSLPSITTTSLSNWDATMPGYEQTVIASEGTGSLTFSLESGTSLPPGLSLNSTTGVITGTPTTVGAYTFDIVATDTLGQAATEAYIVTINSALTFTTTTLANWDQNVAKYNQTISTSGGQGTRILSLQSGDSLPPGLSLNGSTGAITGTPTTAGSFTFHILVSDGLGLSTSQAYTVTVNAPPKVTTTTISDWDVSRSGFDQTLSTTGGTGSLTFSLKSGSILPSGLKLNSSTGAITGTPSKTGTFSFTIEVKDSLGLTATQSLSVAILSGPTISTATISNWDENLANYNQTVQASGIGTLTFTVKSGTSLPMGLSLDSSTGAITGTPTTAGKVTFSVVVTDSLGASTTKSYTITINAPLAITTSALSDWDQNSTSYSQIVKTTGGSGPNSFALQSGTYLPTGLSLNGTTGAITGTPTTTGSLTFDVIVTDSVGGSATQGYTVTINSPLVFTQSTLANWDLNRTGYSQTISAGGGEGTLKLSFTSGSLPTGLTFNAATGILAGTPSKTGTFKFTITVTDSLGAIASQTYTVIIAGLPSISASALATWDQNFSGYNQTVEITGGTGPFNFSMKSGNSLPTGLSLNSSTGVITGTPTTAGTFAFSIVVTDSLGESATKSYTVTISPPPEITTTSLANGNVNKTYSQTVAATGGSGTKKFSLESGDSLPNGLALNTSTGVISGKPTKAGTYTFTINFTDSIGDIASEEYSITIS